MASARTKIGHALAKGLGIKLQKSQPFRDEVTRGESIMSINTVDTFVEEAPTTRDYIREIAPSGQDVADYAKSLFPFLSWIGKYNLQWLAGDLVAGITIGAVVVPQGMAYAILANLDPQFGLYSSFMGVLVYWIFATSKDITIGPVAVMSQVTGTVVLEVGAQLGSGYPAHVIASALAILAGAIVCFIGLIRIGWIVDLIPVTALSAFMTGSAINIAAGQVPAMMGITFPKPWTTRDPTYRVIINTFKYLPLTKLDAAMGLTALFLLYLIRSGCTLLANRFPTQKRTIFFISTLRTVFVLLLYTMVSWLVNMNHRSSPLFKILGTVPRGFQNAAVPVLDKTLASALVSYLPSSVIVLLIEHIAISKSFGRVNNYTINPSQEMVAIGVTNLLGPFLGGYPATGSFSRTAIKSKAGVRTPFAGVITAVIVLLAIYALPAVFFYIPNSALAAVIIHAVGDLITPPNTVYQFWRISPLEVLIFFVGVIVTIFTSIENGIYCTISISAAMLLYRILRSRGRFLGQLKVHSVLGDHVIGNDSATRLGEYGTMTTGPNSSESGVRNIFLPIDHGDGSNPEVELDQPYPGVFIYRFSEGFNYPNASHTLEYLVQYIFARTSRTNPNEYDRRGDRPWNDPGPSRRAAKKAAAQDTHSSTKSGDLLPTLKAVILDFSSVNNVDITSVQTLIDIRNQLDRYTAPNVVDWHIACINNRWAKQALVSAGFGYPAERSDGLHHRWQSIFSVAEIGGSDSAAAAAEQLLNDQVRRELTRQKSQVGAEEGRAGEGADEIRSEASGSDASPADELKGGVRGKSRTVAVHGLNRPLFHVDLTSAVQSAIANVQARGNAGPAQASK